MELDENLIKKIKPHSDDAEKSVLGSMLMDRDAISTAQDLLIPSDFYQNQNGILFQAMVTLYNEGKAVDPVTLREKLKEMGAPDSICQLDTLRELVSIVPTSTNIKNYASIVHDKATLRKLIEVSEEITNNAYLAKEDTEMLLEDMEKKVFQLIQNRRGSDDFIPIQKVVLNCLVAIEEAAKSDGNVTGVETGFYDLDAKLTGLHASELILIAARPAMGKTAFVLNIAQHAAFRKGVPTAIFSLEMSKEQLVTRLMAMESMVDSQNIRTGNLREEEWEKLMESTDVIGQSNLMIDDTPGITVSELRSKCRKFKQTNGLGLVIIDYLQLMSGSKKGGSESRQQEVSEISRSLKALAREIDVPVIALSQLSRAVESRPDKRPMMSDLRESGAIEQDADVVMFIYRDDYYNEDSEKQGIAEIIVSKQRNGSTGTVELIWLGQYTKFANREKSHHS